MQLIEKAIVRDYFTEPVQGLNSRALHKGCMLVLYKPFMNIIIPLLVQIVGGQWCT